MIICKKVLSITISILLKEGDNEERDNKMKKSEKKNYHSYAREEQIQDLISNIDKDGVSNDQYIQYCELRGFCYPNHKSRK